MWQVSDPDDHIFTWLAGEDSPEMRQAMLDWLPRLAADPEGVASAVLPRAGVPAFTAAVLPTDAFVDYILVEQYNCVLILDVIDFGWHTGFENEETPPPA